MEVFVFFDCVTVSTATPFQFLFRGEFASTLCALIARIVFVQRNTVSDSFQRHARPRGTVSAISEALAVLRTKCSTTLGC